VPQPWRPDDRDRSFRTASAALTLDIPHVAQTSGRRSAIDRRTTRHPGCEVSQRIRKRIEEPFGWAKTVADLRKMPCGCFKADGREKRLRL
jgi:hypothetical protein